MDPKDILVRIEMLEAGIVPFGYDAELKEIERGLDSLSPELRRKAKRKFRKMWRKAAKRQDRRRASRRGVPKESKFARATSSGSKPDDVQRAIRKALVRRQFMEDDK